jgi:oxalate decarboxylase/phosphoglucose isomerase-like protein (cupin superfamily)
MNVYLPSESPNWWEMRPGDAAFIPEGVAHAFFNTSDLPAKFLFSVAPTYR